MNTFSNGENSGASGGIAICAGEISSLKNYPGAKGQAGVFQTIINQIPPHETYIEAFVGSGQIVRRKRPARCSIVIDKDAAVFAEWEKNSAVTAVCADARSWLLQYEWKGGEVVYCDPPYLFSVRSCQRDYYRCEMGEEKEHRELIEVLKMIPAKVLLSGYPSPLYQELMPDWRLITFETILRTGKMATEGLWMNYPEPFELHEYTFLGANFRERERIKRKKTRWKNKLSGMSMLERGAILEAIRDLTAENGEAGRRSSVKVSIPDPIVKNGVAVSSIAKNDVEISPSKIAMAADYPSLSKSHISAEGEIH